jgi:GTP pyrophosphokinase
MIRIEDIVDKVSVNHPMADLDLLRRAYLFSAREHKGQKRASGESLSGTSSRSSKHPGRI